MNAPHPDWIRPEWPAPVRVQALITTRAGGLSQAPYASLNLGTHVGDDPQQVAANRARLNQVLPQAPYWLHQVHGHQVVVAGTPTAEPPPADASISTRANTVCVVMVADCLPILLCDRRGTCVGIAHAGWRGLASGVVAQTVAALPASPNELLAYLGPCIGPNAFEVGDEVRQAYLTLDPQHATAFRPHPSGRWWCDLPNLARQVLHHSGVSAIYGGQDCTVSDPERFFSYRRNGVTGRMAALIWLTDPSAQHTMDSASLT